MAIALVWAIWPGDAPAQQVASAPERSLEPSSSPLTPDQLQQLVAPIALYPDSLVVQILAASTYPVQIVEAERFLQAHPDLKGDALARAVDQQPWDPSVKALTAFPSVLGNMDRNISWTSALGDAYYNQAEATMNAVQDLRQRAEQAGTLTSTPQQTVTTSGSTIVIQPANPTVVYVPAYDPWVVYGAPIVAWPSWYAYPGIWYAGPNLFFGVGFGIGFYGVYSWGWHHWDSDWHHHVIVYDHNRYHSHSRTFYDRDRYYHAYGGHGGPTYVWRGAGRGGSETSHGSGQSRGRESTPFAGNSREYRGFDRGRGQEGVHSSAFSSYGNGGMARNESARGRSRLGGDGQHHGRQGSHRH